MATLTSDFERLMEEMSQGSEEAAWELTELYTPHIIRAVRASLPRVIRSKVDSQDFVQAVWSSVLLKRGRLTQFRKPEHFIGYLAVTARNKVIETYRHLLTLKRDVRTEVTIAELEIPYDQRKVLDCSHDQMPKSKEPTPSQVAIVREAWERIVANSSERDQQVVLLRISGLPYGEIADRLSIGEKTVRRALIRILEQFEE
jgi:RNA polymerase sigma factor (sigma-70 family)